MKKTIFGLASLFVIAIALVGFTMAHAEDSNNLQDADEDSYRGYRIHHTEMIEIMENGSYDDLVSYRENNEGFSGPYWVDSEEEFKQWQEFHEDGGCPMMSGNYGNGDRMRRHMR